MSESEKVALLDRMIARAQARADQEVADLKKLAQHESPVVRQAERLAQTQKKGAKHV